MLLLLGGVLFAGYKLAGAFVAEGQRMPVAAQAEGEPASRDDGVALVDAPASRSIWRRLANALARCAAAVASMAMEILRAAWPEVKPAIVKAVVAYATERLAPDVAVAEEHPHPTSRTPVVRAMGRTAAAIHA